jgi:hypothetical protein
MAFGSLFMEERKMGRNLSVLLAALLAVTACTHHDSSKDQTPAPSPQDTPNTSDVKANDSDMRLFSFNDTEGGFFGFYGGNDTSISAKQVSNTQVEFSGKRGNTPYDFFVERATPTQLHVHGADGLPIDYWVTRETPTQLHFTGTTQGLDMDIWSSQETPKQNHISGSRAGQSVDFWISQETSTQIHILGTFGSHQPISLWIEAVNKDQMHVTGNGPKGETIQLWATRDRAEDPQVLINGTNSLGQQLYYAGGSDFPLPGDWIMSLLGIPFQTIF